jgi:hypothetical protein
MEANDFINAEPNPEYLIRSIAEQGYSLETALADLIDNSITAGADYIEILTEIIDDVITLLIVDNGTGMNYDELCLNMQFPSNINKKRVEYDLGRFGLGLKTASFSQSRRFTVLSKKTNEINYSALTWDVKYLKTTGKWRIIVNNKFEIDNLFNVYKKISQNRINHLDTNNPNTIIIWQGLYKFSNNLEFLNKQLVEVTSEYLGIVFHRFLERTLNPLQIKINNSYVVPFNPFPVRDKPELRSLGERQRIFKNNTFKMEGFVLPVSSTDQENEAGWKTKKLGLLDLEGVFVYRGNRIIYFGGWNGLIKKETKLKLARLRIDISNANDKEFQLNVSKSRIIIPQELIVSVLDYITYLKIEAKNELTKRGIRRNSSLKKNAHTDLFNRIPTSNGVKLDFNMEYPLLKSIIQQLDEKQNRQIDLLLKVISSKFNYNKDSADIQNTIDEIVDSSFSEEDIIEAIIQFKNKGWSKDKIVNLFLKDIGLSDKSFSEKINIVLNKKV